MGSKRREQLKEEGNRILQKHKSRYGYLRGFRKPIKELLQNQLDGGHERIVNIFDINDYKMPR
ncbi:MAG: hypothetical protein GXO19_07975 [Epsilonproteobacteria bacterium]|nr:hypothetical protein [Campylobacterota bacterium]NPA57648.1 hypothetical protein [Campylobacterota bacterium]